VRVPQNQTIQYLTRVGVFDQETWGSIHHVVRYEDPKRLPIFPGNAHQRLRTALADVNYWVKQGTDIYMAQGLFMKPGETRAGGYYPNADRHKGNLGWCKNLYMDIDVKPGAYSTQQDAIRALINDMVRPYKIPAPTIMVSSGSGGIHAYWTLNDIFDPKIFSKMASSLSQIAKAAKIYFDQNCTTDPVHLFRVPWTWNYKKPDNPTLVEILDDCGKDIDIDEMKTALFAAAPPTSHSKSYNAASSNAPSEFDDNDDLGGGMERNYAPANIDTVAAVCPLIKDTLANGGANHSESEWHAMASLSCHCENPSETFHRLSKGYPRYDPEETDAKLAVAQDQRKNSHVGPHMCAKLSELFGEKFCNTCPHLALGTTPLWVPFKRTNGHAYLPPINHAPNSSDLPTPYYRAADNLIYRPRPDDGKENASDMLAFEYQIQPGSGYVEDGYPYSFHFTTFQGEQYASKSVEMNVVPNQTRLIDTLSGIGLPINGDRKEAMVFLMSYTKLLQSKRDTAISLPPFGWAIDNKEKFGFSYGGEFVSPNGTMKCKSPPPNLNDYTPVGDPLVWRDLAEMIITSDRPDLSVMAARAFGAPLVRLTGEAGCIVGVYSAESGIGKTSSLMLGQAVYSRPILMGLTDTNSYVFSRAGDLKHLPLYYDEIKGDEQISAFCKIVFQLTGGGGKGRAGRDGQAKEKKTFETSVDYASNKPMVPEVRERDKGTDASAYRVFEFEGKPSSGSEAFNAAVGKQFALLKTNYGWVGREYATFLGRNEDYIKKRMNTVQNWLNNAVAPTREERFWAAAVVTSFVGADLAVGLGFCHFPLKEMWNFMIAEYRRMRNELTLNSSDFGNEDTVIRILSAYLSDKRARNMIILDKTLGRGRPSPTQIQNPPRAGFEDQWGPLEVQVSGDPFTIRFTDISFSRWCKQNGFPKNAICAGLKKALGVDMTTVTIGAGSSRPEAKTMGWSLLVTGNKLDDVMEEYRLYYNLKP
jgi:hypothetical protein